MHNPPRLPQPTPPGRALEPVDTLPRALRDEPLTFEGYWQPGAVSRLRLYQDPEGHALIVLTELPDNRNTSVTNRAERAFYLAWERCGKPLPVRFIEHYPGRARGPFRPHPVRSEAETLDWVVFPGTSGDGPVIRLASILHQALPQFLQPRWLPFPLADLFCLIGPARQEEP